MRIFKYWNVRDCKIFCEYYYFMGFLFLLKIKKFKCLLVIFKILKI